MPKNFLESGEEPRQQVQAQVLLKEIQLLLENQNKLLASINVQAHLQEEKLKQQEEALNELSLRIVKDSAPSSPLTHFLSKLDTGKLTKIAIYAAGLFAEDNDTETEKG
jgi:hypothetical protein